MSAPVVVAAEEAANPLTHGIEKLLHELSVLPLKGDHLAVADSFNPGSFTLTNYMFWMIVAFILLALFFILASRKAKLVPSGLYNIAEAGVSFVRDSLCVDVMGPEGLKYFPFIGTVFFFVLFNNLLGNIPPALPGTGTVGTTFLWGIIVFVVYNGIGIKKSGLVPYVKSFVPSGTPAVMAPLIFLLEIVSHLLRPFTLGIRLFANMYAGHIMLGVFAVFMAVAIEGFSATSAVVLPLSFLMQVILRAFELFVAVLQAYIFSILTAVYINGALHQAEH
ncbi:MAG TPA: F0F1 ATP synthase subunit A [Coriobacteriia bacterium]|nr:F0F1 ATP synthase subunit A [Coriobacteriia bacterium]